MSRGDDALLALGDAIAWHFPLDANGRWAGHYPADTLSVVAQLEAVRDAGAEYLLLPEPGFWWLDHYAGLGEYLLRRGEEVARTPDLRLYRLAGSRQPAHQIASSMERVT